MDKIALIWSRLAFMGGLLLIITGWSMGTGSFGLEKDTSTVPVLYMLLGIYWAAVALYCKPS